jgi:hypothetical protein
LRDRPVVAQSESVDDLIDIICDPDRRGLVFLAGASPDQPWDVWRADVERYLAETVGLAAAYILDPGATAALARAIPSHAVYPMTIRTYLPGADPASGVDARRHRWLSAERMASSPRGSLAKTLGIAARGQQRAEPLPTHIRRADRAMQRLENQLLVHGLGELDRATPVATPLVTANASRPTERLSEIDLRMRVLALADELLPVPSPDEDVFEQVARLARSGAARHDQSTVFAGRVESLQSSVEHLQDERDQLQVLVEDAQLEQAEATQEAVRLSDQVRFLQRQLEQQGHAELAWSDVPSADRTKVPTSFADLIEALDSLTHITFTGQSERAIELDGHDPLGNWAAKAWEALLALEDYASCKEAGLCTTGVFDYLSNVPAGFRGYSANQHSAVESEAVRNNPKFHDARVFPGPRDELVFMEAHFKLGAKRTISPRLHYFDNSQGDGRMYVGYIGRHLPNTRTN